uniref:MSTP153 n=3 Tax=Homininae TaxID=207598 RepID=Q7Z4C0_HUMAN|nr:MSTP153 [Homo sapiens]
MQSLTWLLITRMKIIMEKDKIIYQLVCYYSPCIKILLKYVKGKFLRFKKNLVTYRDGEFRCQRWGDLFL